MEEPVRRYDGTAHQALHEQHMIDFLCDAEHYFGMTRNDFAPWEGRVLLILSEGRHHLHPGLPGEPDRPDAKSHGGSPT